MSDAGDCPRCGISHFYSTSCIECRGCGLEKQAADMTLATKLTLGVGFDGKDFGGNIPQAPSSEIDERPIITLRVKKIIEYVRQLKTAPNQYYTTNEWDLIEMCDQRARDEEEINRLRVDSVELRLFHGYYKAEHANLTEENQRLKGFLNNDSVIENNDLKRRMTGASVFVKSAKITIDQKWRGEGLQFGPEHRECIHHDLDHAIEILKAREVLASDSGGEK